MVMIVAAPEHYTDFAAVVDGEPPEAIFETGTASISCSSTFAGEIDVRIEADYSVTAVEQLMMVMVMIMSRTKTSELTIVRRSPESRLSTSRLPEGLSRASWLPVGGRVVGGGVGMVITVMT